VRGQLIRELNTKRRTPFSPSQQYSRATASAAYGSGAWTVTMLMILLLVCALTMLADLRQAASGPLSTVTAPYSC
jgi:hypothetical protein